MQECQGGNGKGSVLVVKGLTEGKVASAEEALALIQQGQENRKVRFGNVVTVCWVCFAELRWHLEA